MSKSVFAIANSQGQARTIIERLKENGFAESEISVLLPDTAGTHDVGHVKASKLPEGAATGAASGGAVGGILGLLGGLGALAIPGVGPFIAAGPLMAALSGAALGATAGGIAGSLIGLGIPEVEAKHYEEKLKKGNYLVSVHAQNDDQLERAKDIFEDTMAEDITTSSEAAVPKP